MPNLNRDLVKVVISAYPFLSVYLLDCLSMNFLRVTWGHGLGESIKTVPYVAYFSFYLFVIDLRVFAGWTIVT